MTLIIVLNAIGAAFVVIGILTILVWGIATQFDVPFATARSGRRLGLDRRRPSRQRRPALNAERRRGERRSTGRGFRRGLPA